MSEEIGEGGYESPQPEDEVPAPDKGVSGKASPVETDDGQSGKPNGDSAGNDRNDGERGSGQ
ncbi:hypothetical protein IV498_11210 [Paenarthrobacter sp. Z7-10]|uniref:hypothetical protein n=1 Tax=Paenarthrobacter sp. Z7-10 TaxID=2787635 RepID=UPI0022A9B83C|nr:hypothetical protein [Paenarthrobacter sp. Z7-10]MCZ2403739.1 hypothetical protein [Paenarthrobacter sp. Z7-10]